MELMVVVIIVSLIAGFAIPNYMNVVTKGQKDYAKEQLRIIHAANQIYRSKFGAYWPTDLNTYQLSDINEQLNINIIAGPLEIKCKGVVNGEYQCAAYPPPATSSWCYELSPDLLSATNPLYKASGSCI